ncbi:hypothetical protein [Streptomyces goshikiensis]
MTGRNERDLAARRGFTYSVLEGEDGDEVIGCLYICPSKEREGRASVSS